MRAAQLFILMSAVIAVNTLGISLASGAVETVVITGKKCPEGGCKVFYDQNMNDYDPFAAPTGGGGTALTNKAQAVVEAIKANPPCKPNNESCSSYVTRSFGICIDRVLSATVSSGYTLAAATQACSPFRADAAVGCATNTVATCNAP